MCWAQRRRVVLRGDCGSGVLGGGCGILEHGYRGRTRVASDEWQLDLGWKWKEGATRVHEEEDLRVLVPGSGRICDETVRPT